MTRQELEELLSTLTKWRAEGRKLILRLEQPGRTNLNAEMGACASIESVPEDADGEISFRFGSGTAHGVLSIPLSNGISYKTRKGGEPSFPRRVPAHFEACIKFTWRVGEDFLCVCAFPEGKP